MAQLLLPDLDDRIIARLRDRARQSGRSIEEEATLILTEMAPLLTWPEFTERAESLRAQIAPQQTRAVDLIREDRDR